MPQFDVVFALTGDLYLNSRALKQLASLAGANLSVHVIHTGGSARRVSLPETVTESIVNSFAGRGPLRFWRIHKEFRRTLSTVSARIYHASDLYILAVCHEVAAQRKASYTFDSRELYAHVAATAARPWARWWWTRVERKHISGAASVFTVSDSIADALVEAYSIRRPAVVHNAPNAPTASTTPGTDSSSFSASLSATAGIELRSLLKLDRETLIVHLGQMKKARGCSNLVRAMQSVEGAHLVFLGYGPLQTELKSLSHELELQERIHFVDPVPAHDIRRAIVSADIGVTLLEDTCLNHRFALPNKLFDYLHASLPVLGSNLDEIRSIMNRYEVGMLANASHPVDIARVLNQMINHPNTEIWKNNTRKAAETFRWECASQLFMNEFNRVLSSTLSA